MRKYTALALVLFTVGADDMPYRLSSAEMLGPTTYATPKEWSRAWEELKARFDGKLVQAEGRIDSNVVVLSTDKKQGVSFLVVFKPTDKQKAEIKAARMGAEKKEKELRITVTGTCKFNKYDPKEPPSPLIRQEFPDEFPYYVSIEKPTIKLSLR